MECWMEEVVCDLTNPLEIRESDIEVGRMRSEGL